MAINSVYFIGIGAIGMKYAARLYDYHPEMVKVIADDKRIEKYQSNRPSVNGKKYDFNYITPNSNAPIADLIIIAVKSRHLAAALVDIKTFIGSDTRIMSLMNGISSEDEIAKIYGPECVIYANVYMDAARNGNDVTYKDIGRIVFGHKTNSPPMNDVINIKNLLDEINVPNHIPEDMLRAHWAKFMLNIGLNQVSAVLHAPYGVFQTNEYARALMLSAAQEIVAISQKAGVNLNQDDITNFLRILDSLNPDGKTSMHQDIEAKRETEIDIFAGTVKALGEKYQTPTPVNDVLFQIIKAIDTQNNKS